MDSVHHSEAIKLLHKGELQKLENVVTKNIRKEKNATQESIMFGNMILMDGYISKGKLKEAFELFEQLIINPSVQKNNHMKSKLFRCINYFLFRISPKSVEIRPYMSHSNINLMNASLVIHNNQMVSLIRGHNYKRDNKRYIISGDPWDRIISKTFVYIYDNYFRILFHKEVEDFGVYPRSIQSPIIGYEDPRVFSYNNTLYFTATSLECFNHPRPTMVLCRLDNKYNVDKTVILQCQNMTDQQKNWLPFVDEKNRVLVIYKFSPFIINEIDIENGSFKEIVNREIPQTFFPFIRGSTSPIPYNEGYLFSVHFVNYDTPVEDTYFTKLVWMNKSFEIKKISGTFILEHLGVEYISGLVNWNGNIYMSYNIHDTQSKLARFHRITLDHHMKWYDFNTGKSCQL